MIAFTRKTDKHFLKARTLKLSPSLSPSSPLPPDDNSSPPATLSLSTCGVARSDSHRAVLDVKPQPGKVREAPGARDVRDAKPICSHRPTLALPYIIYSQRTHTHTCCSVEFQSGPAIETTHVAFVAPLGVGHKLVWDTSWRKSWRGTLKHTHTWPWD